MGGGGEGADRPKPRLGPVEVLLLTSWCGLAAGELEVAARALRRVSNEADGMYQVTRHFVWLVPTIDLAIFLGFGAIGALATLAWPRRAGGLALRLAIALAVLPPLLILGRGIYPSAWLVFAIGFAAWLAPAVERRRDAVRRGLALTSPALLAAVAIQGLGIVANDRQARAAEAARPSPGPEAPNVLLVVLDTVRADHLGVYGYGRPTSPHMDRLAGRGVRFAEARAAAPWTLASHASLFTGRWPHELGIKWLHPMPDGPPTLAGYLGSLGYATAGFVGNTFYCGHDSGLDRGFAEYRDYVLDPIAAVRTVFLLDEILDAIAPFEPIVDRWLSFALGGRSVRNLTHVDRKFAPIVNGELLDWLDRRDRRRPFFAFVNYVDAHAPYFLPPEAPYRFGNGPSTEAEYYFLVDGWIRYDKARFTRAALALGRDCYDSCIAYLDEQLDALLEGMRRRGELDRTIVIVTSDHGEGFGEHGLFDHGESLYRHEIRVPLLISMPGGGAAGRVVDEFVSLRDIPATIAELVGGGVESPFPGRSLAPLLREASAEPGPAGSEVLSELSALNPGDLNGGRAPASRGPLLSLAEGNLVYIRNEGDGQEQLFNDREDPWEVTDLSRSATGSTALGGLRDRLRRLTDDREAE